MAELSERLQAALGAAYRVERELGGGGMSPRVRGRVNERLGNRDRALEGYALVVRARRHPDPALKPFVDEARAALARLAGEKR